MLSEERPYEKCERFGAGSLTDIELLAVLLRTGTKGESALDLARKLFIPEKVHSHKPKPIFKAGQKKNC